MRIKFAVDLDAEKSRNRARNHVFSDFGCFIEFSFPDPIGHFGYSGRGGVAGGAALQAVSECPWRRQAGIQSKNRPFWPS